MRLSISILAFLALCQTTQASTLQCPESLKTNQSPQGKTAGWDNFMDDSNALSSFSRVTFYAGHPKEQASLAPDQGKPKNNQLTWTFGNEPIWLACGYTNTHVQLIKKLPDLSKRCIVTYDKAMAQVQKIECN